MFVDFLPYNSIFCKISRNDVVFDLLNKYFVVHTKEFNPAENKSVKLPHNVLKYDDDFIYIPLNYVNHVSTYLFENGLICDSDNLTKIDYPKFEYDDFWIEKFSSREGQLELWESICSSKRGVIQCYTGFGKSLFIVALASCYRGSGNILISVPFNSIKEELILRFKELGITISNGFDVNNKINIINVVGYCNSNAYDNKLVNDWMANVDLIEIDECENITESLASVLNDKVINIKYIFGFSASADKLDGKMLNNKINNLFEFNEPTYWVTAYVGFCIMYKKSEKPVDLHIISSTFGAKRLPFHNTPMEYRLSIKNVISHENFEKCLNFILHNKHEILFIPINEIKTGNYIYDLVQKLGFDPVCWSASEGVRSNHGLHSYEDIKNYCSNNKLDVLLASKVGFLGIDISQLSDCLLIQGTQYNSIIQPLGRCMRNKNPAIWLLDEMNQNKNSFYKNCHWKRLGIIKRTYKHKEILHPYSQIKEFNE